MADVTQQVLIEFITNDEQLKSSEDRLVALGKTEKSNADQFKAANTEINKQVQSLKNLEAVNSAVGKSGNNLKKTVADVATAVKGMSSTFQKEFKGGMIEALKEAGVSAEEFESALEGIGTQTTSLRSQLREMTQSLAQMKVEGKDNTDQYRALAQQAGQLKDAMADANQEVKNFGSDTSTFDGLIGAVQGVAGGFAIVQGATALFGDESEELQKTLLRVNAAMAILQGLQQVQIVLQKESAASQLLTNIGMKAYNFIIGTSTGLTKAFRVALAATGVGVFILAIYELYEAFKTSNEEMEEANKLIEQQTQLLDGLNDAIQRSSDVEQARLELAGAAESEILKAQGRALLRQREGLVAQNKALAIQRDQLSATSEAWFTLNEQIDKNAEALLGIDSQIVVKSINVEKQIADERREAAKQAADEAKRRREEAAQKEREARAAGFADFKAAVELELLAAEEGSREQLEIRKRLARAELQLALDNEKLTQNQRKLLIQKYFDERIQLEKDFAKERDKVTFENISAGIQADLAQLEVSNERKLELQETAIRLAAQVEIAATEGNSAKIEEINAKRDKAIRDARIASIQEIANYEIALAEATNGPEARRLARVVANGEEELSVRIDAIDRLAEKDQSAITKRLEALNKEKAQGLISQKDYNLQYAQLVDQQAKIWEDAEQKKTDITKEEAAKRREETIREIQQVAEVASTVIGVLSSLYSLQSESENQRIAEQKQKLKDLQEAGAITEKEAISRQKRIEAEERKIRQAQAQREKQIAVFNALLSIPQAFLKGLEQGGLILATIYGAIAAAQAAIVISRPVPKFGKGKKNSYQGLAEVGETGPELIERDGKMYIAPKRTITYFGAKDKVFNPIETAAMLSKPSMNTERIETIKEGTTFKIDYEKIGKEVGKHVKTDVHVDGYHKQHIEKNSFTQYLDNKRSL